MVAASDDMEDEIIGYVDTSSFMAITIAEDVHHDDAIRAINAAVRSGWRLIISHMVIFEAISAVCKRITTSYKHQSGSKEEQAGVEATANATVAHMFKILGRMVKQGILGIARQDGWSPDFSHLCDKALAHKGRTVYVVSSKSYRHRGIGAFDLMHYAFARDAGASVIITSDAAFADIEGSDDEFGHIRVQLTGEPLIRLPGGGAEPDRRSANR